MSNRNDGDIERSGPRQPRPREGEPPERVPDSEVSAVDRRSGNEPAGGDASETLADAIAAEATRPTTVETDSVSATLVGVPEIELREFVYAHELPDPETEATRPVALFDLENRTDRPVRWRSARTKFVGDDGYTYGSAHVSLEPSKLGPGCHTRQVEIEPGSRARMVTLVERLPERVDISRVVQTVARRGPVDNERLVFSVE